MPGLGTSFGRGGATTAQQDLSNADAILIMGSSMAENHPVGFQWVVEARERGGKVIHVDPRFSRTSAMADMLEVKDHFTTSAAAEGAACTSFFLAGAYRQT